MVIGRRRTYREADGQRIEGTWRLIFTRSMDTYSLTELYIYADGAIDCGGGKLTNLDGLRAALRSGKVATTPEEGARGYAHHLAAWRFTEPQPWIDADMLVGEAADEIDRLNDRPDSMRRCLLAAQTYLDEMTEDNRQALLEAYLAIPEHFRLYTLGDMDLKDRPLRVLLSRIGEPLYGETDGPTVTADMHAHTIEYFRRRERDAAEWEARTPADGPAIAAAAPISVNRTVYPKGWPPNPGVQVLQNDYPATITVDDRRYPSVTHAYWALSTSDPAWHDRIAAEPRSFDAADLAKQAPRRPGWPAARLAVMTALLRAKYTQHADLGRTLLDTGDARLMYIDFDSAYWVAGTKRGSNWIGRLLEVVRSDLAAEEAGISVGRPHEGHSPTSG